MKKNKFNKSKKKCRYWNRGYCREGSECTWYHEEIDCWSFVQEGHCKEKRCMKRHRKTCRYWAYRDIGCLRGDQCQYLHQKIRRKSKQESESDVEFEQSEDGEISESEEIE